jgi:hypothetical protein
MKQRMILLSALLVVFLSASAKKLKVTIDGTARPSQESIYLIVNEDTATALLVPVNEGKFKVTVKVNEDDYIRLVENKAYRPDVRSVVIIADERHITVNMESNTVEHSYMTKCLKDRIGEIESAGPGTFHIDVFSDNKEDWEKARAEEKEIRARMKEQQRMVVKQVLEDERYNVIPAWILILYPEQASPWLDKYFEEFSTWLDHPVLKKK